MKVLDLGCRHGHVFEGWFASEDDYRDQRERGLLECPVCGDQAVEKRLSAPYVQTRRTEDAGAREGGREEAGGGTPAESVPALTPQQQGRLLRALRAWVRDSEDVGERFAAEARAIHQGEAPARSIRGVATPDEALALVEEGVPILPLPDLPLLKEPLQ